ncbi:MAG: hypothetical protein J6W52_10065 [Bacteroidaceae bacterium]|nr:hypothetical protein [Bacteroidaceae bacterium]
MIDYKVCLNNGNEVLGIDQKTITANEDLRTVDEEALAREIHHENGLIPEQVARAVLENFCKAAANLMSMGFAIQLRNNKDVALRIHPDLHIEGGSINLARARELMPDKVSTEEDMVKYAGELVSRAGVSIRVKSECQQKFTDLLMSLNPSVNRAGMIERAKVTRLDSDDEDEPGNGGTVTPDPVNPDPGNGDDNGNDNPNPNPGGDDPIED